MCIYCESTDLTESHIIPYALSGVEIKRTFVCSQHNSDTNKFEEIVIQRLASIRNHLGLKKRKKKDQIKFKADIRIKDTIIENATLSDRDYFYGGQNVFSGRRGDDIVKFGDIEELQEFAESRAIEPVDSNDITLEFPLDLHELFASHEMKRTVAKIAYEWHCYKNDINQYNVKYKNITDYILKGIDKNYVEVVIDNYIYYLHSNLCEYGTNSLFEYTDSEGTVFVVFNFWNIIYYKVRIDESDIKNTTFSHSLNIHLFNIDGSSDTVNFRILGDLIILSIDPLEAIGRYKEFYKQRLKSLFTTFVLSLYKAQDMITLVSDDLDKLEKGLIDFSKFIHYEDWPTVFAIELLLQLTKQEDKYDFEKCFNENIKNILGCGDTNIYHKENKYELLHKHKELFDTKELFTLLKKGLTIFNKIYAIETEKTSTCSP